MACLSMNELTTYRWSFEEDLLHYQRAGYDGIGVWLQSLQEFGEERAVELIEESGLTVTNVSWAGGFTGGDAVTATENIDEACRTLDLCRELNAKSLTVYTGGRNGHTRRHADRLFRSALDAILPHAEDTGVPLAIEPMHPNCAEEWTIFTSLSGLLDVLQEYESPVLRASLDTYHFPTLSDDFDLLSEISPYLATVHVGDYSEARSIDQSRCPLGEGQAPLVEVFRTLIQSGYDGCFDVKLLGPQITPGDYDELLKQSITALRALEEQARLSAPAETCSTTW